MLKCDKTALSIIYLKSMKNNYLIPFNFIIKITLIAFFFLASNNIFSQNVGVGTTTPTNSFHVVRAPGNPNPDPLRVENLRLTTSDTSFLVIDNQGVVKYMNLSQLTSRVFTKLDSIIIVTMINNADTLFSSQSFSDSLRGFIYNNADTLFANQPWLDSLSTLLKDSIDTDVDSLVISPLDSLYLYEDGKRISVYLPDLDSTNELIDSIFLIGDSIVIREKNRSHFLNIKSIIDSFETVTTITNTDSTISYTDENGITTVINIKGMVDSSETVTSITFTDSTITYFDENGSPTLINIAAMIDSNETITTLVDNNDGTFTYTNEAGVVTNFDAKDTVLTHFGQLGDSIYYVDENGDSTKLYYNDDTTAITTLVDNNDGTFTYTNEAGVVTNFDAKDTVLTHFGQLGDSIYYVDENGDSTKLYYNDDTTAITTLVDNNDGTFTYTNEAGVVTNFDAKDTVLTHFGQLGDSIYYVDENGDSTKLYYNDDTTAITTLVDNNDGTFTYTNEAGVVTNFDAKDTVLTHFGQLGDSIYYVDENGDSSKVFANQETLTTLNFSNDTLIYTDESMNETKIFLQDLDSTNEKIDTIYKQGDSLVVVEGGDTLYVDYGDGDWRINANGTGLEGIPGGSTASGANSLAGGLVNNATGFTALSFGGSNNNVSGLGASNIGGSLNTVSGNQASNLGGFTNNVSGFQSINLGGENNLVSGDRSTIIGGDNDTVGGDYSLIGGGRFNKIHSGTSSAILAGQNNYIFSGTMPWLGSSDNSTILGGRRDSIIMSSSASIIGGENSRINRSFHAGIYAGRLNFIDRSQGSVILGGFGDTIFPTTAGYGRSVIIGGEFNKINASVNNLAVVIGGSNNTASGTHSIITGGSNNTAYSYNEWVGGLNSTIYAPFNMTGFDGRDKLFVIGNGTSNIARSNALTLLKDGRIGIGVDGNAAQTATLHVKPQTTIDPLRVEDLNIAQANDSAVLVVNPSNGTVRYLDLDSVGNDHDWYTVGTTNPPSSINDNIFTNNRVSINNPNPTYLFSMYKPNSDAVWQQIANATTGTTSTDGFYFGISSTENAHIWNTEATAMIFHTSNLERMRIDAAGDLGIGNTNPLNRLHVTDLTANDPLRVEGFNPAQVNDSAVLVVNPSNGTVRYLDLDSIGVIDSLSHLRDDTLSVYQGNSISSVILANTMAEIYDVSGSDTVTTSLSAVEFGAAGIVDAGYTTNDSTITVSKAGRYKITYRITLEMLSPPGSAGGNRSEAQFNLFRNNTLIPGTLAGSYHRNTSASVTTANVTKVINLIPGDVIKVRGIQTVGLGILRTKANGSSLLIERL